jgi:hypothetical protein
LIGAVASINSAPGEGCRIQIRLNPLIKDEYPDG